MPAPQQLLDFVLRGHLNGQRVRFGQCLSVLTSLIDKENVTSLDRQIRPGVQELIPIPFLSTDLNHSDLVLLSKTNLCNRTVG